MGSNKIEKKFLDSLSLSALNSVVKPIFIYWFYKSIAVQQLYKFRDRKYKSGIKKIRDDYRGGKVNFTQTHGLLSSKLDWKADKLITGGDVFELPETIWRRKGGDCDSLAIIMYYVFGDTINWGGDIYRFKGFKALIGNRNHIIALYVGFIDDEVKYLVLSNLSFEEMSESEYINYVRNYGGYQVELGNNMKYKTIKKI